jgi:hypothetical protein
MYYDEGYSIPRSYEFTPPFQMIMPLTFASFIVGTSAEYQQDVALYGIFTILSAVLGVCVFFFHSTGNEKVTAFVCSCSTVSRV